MKILCVMPVGKFDERFERSFRSLLEQDHPVKNIFICSEAPFVKTDGTSANLMELNLMYAYNTARSLFLKQKKFDCLLTLESDIVLPKDAVGKLVEGMKGHDQIGACFRLRKGNIAAMKEDANDERPFPNNLHSVANIRETYQAIRQGEVVAVSSVSFGCTLLSRKLLENVAWGADSRFCSDGKWIIDCRTHKMRTALHGGVWCKHIDTDGVVWEVGDIVNKPFVLAVTKGDQYKEWSDVIDQQAKSGHAEILEESKGDKP